MVRLGKIQYSALKRREYSFSMYAYQNGVWLASLVSLYTEEVSCPTLAYSALASIEWSSTLCKRTANHSTETAKEETGFVCDVYFYRHLLHFFPDVHERVVLLTLKSNNHRIMQKKGSKPYLNCFAQKICFVLCWF